MKKFTSIIVAILMIIAMIPLNTFAVNTSATIPEIGLTADKTKVDVGDIITVTVTLPENSRLCDLAYDIIFDASCLSVVENSADLKGVFNLERINTNLSGRIKYAGVTNSYIDDASQVLFTIQFRVLKAPCSIQAEIVEAYEDGEDIFGIDVTHEYSSKILSFEGTHTHSYESVVTAPTCTEAGYTTYTCSGCNDTYTNNETSATGHISGNAVEENYVVPSCTSNGSVDKVVYCSVCNEELSRTTETIEMLGHADNNGDGYCDADNELLDPTVECDCNCHKSGVSNFFFKFALFFQKLFGANKTCDCGVAHY